MESEPLGHDRVSGYEREFIEARQVFERVINAGSAPVEATFEANIGEPGFSPEISARVLISHPEGTGPAQQKLDFLTKIGLTGDLLTRNGVGIKIKIKEGVRDAVVERWTNQQWTRWMIFNGIAGNMYLEDL
jgi:hypothetical protein